jgi:hypothetical protein
MSYREHNSHVGLSKTHGDNLEYTAKCDCGHKSSPTSSLRNARERVRTHNRHDKGVRRDRDAWIS